MPRRRPQFGVLRAVNERGQEDGPSVRWPSMINWLRTEAMLPQTASVLEILGQLENLSKGLAPEDAAKAAALVDQVKRAASAGEFWEAAGDSTAGVHPLSRASRTPITADELSKLTTFITFGSPLNKGDITRILSWERPACLSCDRILSHGHTSSFRLDRRRSAACLALPDSSIG